MARTTAQKSAPQLNNLNNLGAIFCYYRQFALLLISVYRFIHVFFTLCTCHMSCVTCHLSQVTFFSFFFF